jgi:hypothetical protein
MGIKAISLKERTNPLVTKSIFDLHGNQGEIRITISSAGVTAVYESKSPGGINEEVRECCIPMDHNDVFRRGRRGQKTVEKLLQGQAQVSLVKLPWINSAAANICLSPREPDLDAFIERTGLNWQRVQLRESSSDGDDDVAGRTTAILDGAPLKGAHQYCANLGIHDCLQYHRHVDMV